MCFIYFDMQCNHVDMRNDLRRILISHVDIISHRKQHIFIFGTAHRGSILVPDGVGPEASTQYKGPKTPEARSSGRGPKREKRRHSVQTTSIKTGKNTPLHTDSAGISGNYC